MRLIDLDKFPLLPNKLDGHLTEYERGYHDAQSNLNALPNVDAEPVRHGHWERIKYASGDWMRCSFCEDNIWTAREFVELGYLKRFCPKCGAKMEGCSDEE